MTSSDSAIDTDILREAAKKARYQAYAPYSNHPVGAAILTTHGKVFAAGNVENAAYPLGSCAETNAIGTMVAAGYRIIRAVAISGPGDIACPPCGGCRQRLWEFAEPDVPVFLFDCTDRLMEKLLLKDLLPLAFSKVNTHKERIRHD